VTIGCRPKYDEARDLAVNSAVAILRSIHPCTESEARLYIRTVGNLRNGAVWSMGQTKPDWVKTLPLVVGMDVPLHGEALKAYRTHFDRLRGQP
jgi:hypothetical protein